VLLDVAAGGLAALAALLAGLIGPSASARPVAVLAIAAQYLGVALALFAAGRAAAAVATLVLAAGVAGVLWPRRATPPASWLAPRAVARFETGVVALAVFGAVALATARPLLGGPGDAVVDVLVVTGLLCCLLGEARPAGDRVACGLFFVLSAGDALLHLVEPGLAPGATLFLAAAQVGLALAVARTMGGSPDEEPAGIAP
jgi:hypothetical protein